MIGHEIGHVLQFRNGIETHEQNADVIGFFLSMLAGYDPYAGAGFLAKAAMATGTAELTIQNWEAKYSREEAHGSFNDRLDNIYESIQNLCAEPLASGLSAEYKDTYHPHFPPEALLATVAP